jgi:hypothetical protein
MAPVTREANKELKKARALRSRRSSFPDLDKQGTEKETSLRMSPATAHFSS